MGKRIAVYPGSFDPITYGHVDLVRRGGRIFDEIYVAIAVNVGKSPLFTKDERLKLVRESTKSIKNCKAVAYDGLVVDFCRKIGACAILRGIRTVTDFDYEFQIALTNRSFAPGIETVFVMPAEELSYISSSLVKEAVSMRGDVSKFVTPAVNRALKKKLSINGSVSRDWR
jgi:pantetheine-phosphate adenylyltransferase